MAKKFGTVIWIGAILVGVAIAASICFSNRQPENKISSTITTLRFGTTEACNTDVGGCPFHSIAVSNDGSYVIEGDRCAGTEVCKGQLTKSEIVALRRLLEGADLPSLSKAAKNCDAIENEFARNRRWTWVSAEADASMSHMALDVDCADRKTVTRLKNLQWELDAILKPDSHVFSEASSGPDCMAYSSVQSASALWALNYTRVKVHVMTDGTAQEAELSLRSGDKEVDEAAVLGASNCKFKPAKHDGIAVASTVLLGYFWAEDKIRQSAKGSRAYAIHGTPSSSEIARDGALLGRAQ